MTIANELTTLIERRAKIYIELDALWDFYYDEDQRIEGNPEHNIKLMEEAEAKYEADPRVKVLEKETSRLRLDVLDIINLSRNELTFEQIFEGLTSTGDAPSLLYDDNGNFAVESEGIQGVQLDGGKFDKFDGVWFTTKDSWYPTVRQALNYYLDQFFNGWDIEAAKKDVENR